MNTGKTSPWLNPYRYRNAAFAVATVGSLLMSLNWQAQNIAAFIGIMILFVAAFIAIAGVMAGLRQKQGGAIIQCVVLLMWSVLLPLVLLAQQYH